MSEPAPPAPPSSGSRTEPTSAIIGDRACVKCGFNLHGQIVVRDPEYGLLVARCPECGTAASLQEHPILGRWASRWAAMLAAVWLLVIVGLILFSGVVIGLISVGLATDACKPIRERIATSFKEHLVAEQAAMTQEEFQTAYPNFISIASWPADQYPWVTASWWEGQDAAAFLGNGPLDNYDWRIAKTWIPFGLFTFTAGVFLAVTIAHRRGFTLVLPALAIGSISAALVLLVTGEDPVLSAFSGTNWGGLVDLNGLAALHAAGFAFVTVLVQTAVIAAGLMVGRPLARLIVRALVPPRIRAPLGFLWSADRLPQPRTHPPALRQPQ